MSTTVKVSKETNEILKAISEARGRRESKEQVILELVDVYKRKGLDGQVWVKKDEHV